MGALSLGGTSTGRRFREEVGRGRGFKNALLYCAVWSWRRNVGSGQSMWFVTSFMDETNPSRWIASVSSIELMIGDMEKQFYDYCPSALALWVRWLTIDLKRAEIRDSNGRLVRKCLLFSLRRGSSVEREAFWLQ